MRSTFSWSNLEMGPRQENGLPLDRVPWALFMPMRAFAHLLTHLDRTEREEIPLRNNRLVPKGVRHHPRERPTVRMMMAMMMTMMMEVTDQMVTRRVGLHPSLEIESQRPRILRTSRPLRVTKS